MERWRAVRRHRASAALVTSTASQRIMRGDRGTRTGPSSHEATTDRADGPTDLLGARCRGTSPAYRMPQAEPVPVADPRGDRFPQSSGCWIVAGSGSIAGRVSHGLLPQTGAVEGRNRCHGDDDEPRSMIRRETRTTGTAETRTAATARSEVEAASWSTTAPAATAPAAEPMLSAVLTRVVASVRRVSVTRSSAVK